MLIRMSEWANELVNTFAASMKKRRDELGLSAQKLADRTAELGHPVNRSVVAALESGRRNRLLLPDALVIAEALSTSLATLLYPGMPDEGVDQLPGRLMPSWEAALSLLGTEPPLGDSVPENEDEHSTGHALVRASAELQEARELKNHIAFEFTSQDQHLDDEAKARFLSSITFAQQRVSEIESRIQALGGVVYDEFSEGENNG